MKPSFVIIIWLLSLPSFAVSLALIAAQKESYIQYYPSLAQVPLFFFQVATPLIICITQLFPLFSVVVS
jgi:hypothetical protein